MDVIALCWIQKKKTYEKYTYIQSKHSNELQKSSVGFCYSINLAKLGCFTRPCSTAAHIEVIIAISPKHTSIRKLWCSNQPHNNKCEYICVYLNIWVCTFTSLVPIKSDCVKTIQCSRCIWCVNRRVAV